MRLSDTRRRHNKLCVVLLLGLLHSSRTAVASAAEPEHREWAFTGGSSSSSSSASNGAAGRAATGSSSVVAAGSRPGRQLLDTQQLTTPCSFGPAGQPGQGVTGCLQWQQQVGCSLLEAQGYIPGGTQSFLPNTAGGNFSVPGACGSSTVSVTVQQQQLSFDAGGRSVVAIVARGPATTTTFFLGHDTSKGVIRLPQAPTGLELCLAPLGEGAVHITQSAAYSLRPVPGSLTWQLRKTVQLPPAFQDGVVHMFNGDAVEAAWTLAATKTGTDASYQGLLTGSISISNSGQAPVAVYGVLTAIQGGPSATVSCGQALPLQVPACGTAVCSFTATYPQPPAAGQYKATTTVQYQKHGTAAVAVAEAQSTFQVSSSAAATPPAVAKVPAGQAVVTDPQLPGQVLTYTGSGQQSYVTRLECPESGSVVNTATLLASTGQQVTAAAEVRKTCHKLDVRLADVSEPIKARWHWTVEQTASTAHLNLRSVSGLFTDSAQQQPLKQGANSTSSAAAGAAAAVADKAGLEQLSTTQDVTYTVRVTRSLPKGADGKVAPFTLSGKVVVVNPAPINAKLAGVAVTMTDPAGQAAALTVVASCPIIAVPSGQSLTCSWTATPAFNPVGGSMRAVARYVAALNGNQASSGRLVEFESATRVVGEQPLHDAALLSYDHLPTFGGTFMLAGGSGASGTFQRSLKQFGSSADSSSAGSAFNPAGFLSRVWGFTGANTIVTSAAAPTFGPTPSQAAPGSALTPWGNGGGTPVSSSSSSGSSSGALSGPGSAVAGSADPDDAHKRIAAPGSAAQKQVAPAAAAGGSSSSGSGSSGSATAGKRFSSASAAAGDGSSSKAAAEPQGLLDDCADVSHELGVDAGLLPGRLVSGLPPTGRICSSTVFVYSVRYGPYSSCGTGSRAAATARVVTSDTRRVGSSLTEVGISVKGCKPGLEAAVAALRPLAEAKAAWSMRMSANSSRLLLLPQQTARNSYNVSYDWQLEAVAPRLFVMLSLRNTGKAVTLVGEASYTVNMTCGTQHYTRSTPFVCAGNRVAPGEAVNCSLVVPLQCAAKGSLQAQLALPNGQVVFTPVTDFGAPDLEQLATAQASKANCIKVMYQKGPQKGMSVPGRLVAGEVPKGQLCSPRSFSFTRQFGPYSSCGLRTAHLSAGFTTPAGVSRTEKLQTSVEVAGCQGTGDFAPDSAATATAAAAAGEAAAAGWGFGSTAAARSMPASSRLRLARQQKAGMSAHKQAVAAAAASSKHIAGAPASAAGAPKPAGSSSSSATAQPPRGSCVYQPWFWKHCMLPDLPGEPACDVVITSLPGGQGPRTPFFPYRKAPQIRRTYRQLMVAPKKTGNAVVDLHFWAARVYIAAQMNQFSGVTLPADVQQAYAQLGRDYFSVYDDGSAAQELPSKPKLQQRVAAAAQVLADFNSGKYPGLPTCAAWKQQQQQHAKQT